MARSIQISNAEWDVLQIVWEIGPCSAADVIKGLSKSRDWNHRTIRTLLSRLVEKSALDYQVDGSRYIYRAIVSREQCVRQESRSFLEKCFGGDLMEMMVHFSNDSSLSPEELTRLRSLLDKRLRKKGDGKDDKS